MNEMKLIDEMLNSKYRDLLLISPYFNTIFETIHRNEVSEKEMVEIISILCERIVELEKDLNKKIVSRTIDIKEYLSEENIKELKKKLL
jgi:hypothetical protein